MKTLRCGAILSLVGSLLGCANEGAKFRKEYEQELPSIKPSLDVIAKVNEAPFDTPECTKPPEEGAILVLERDEAAHRLRVSSAFHRDPKHPCSALTDAQLTMLGEPFQDARSGAGSSEPKPHTNAYLTAVSAFRACFDGAHTIVALREVGYDPATAGEKGGAEFAGGARHTNVASYSKNGAPICVHRVISRPNFMQMWNARQNHPTDMANTVTQNIGKEHVAKIEAWLGRGANSAQ